MERGHRPPATGRCARARLRRHQKASAQRVGLVGGSQSARRSPTRSGGEVRAGCTSSDCRIDRLGKKSGRHPRWAGFIRPRARGVSKRDRRPAIGRPSAPGSVQQEVIQRASACARTCVQLKVVAETDSGLGETRFEDLRADLRGQVGAAASEFLDIQGSNAAVPPTAINTPCRGWTAGR